MNWFRKIAYNHYPFDPQPRAVKALEQLLNSREPKVRQMATQLRDAVNDYIIVIKTKGSGAEWSRLREVILNLQMRLNMNVYDKFIEYSIPYEETDEWKNIQQAWLERQKKCNIKVLEVDQWTANAPEMANMHTNEFNPDNLSGSGAAAKQFGNNYGYKWVCENDTPRTGAVWFKEDPSGQLVRWKANVDSSG